MSMRPTAVSALLFLLGASAPAPAQEQPARGAYFLTSYRQGVDALEGAAHALAARGVAPDSLEALTVWMSGVNLQRFQSPSPEPPFDTLPSSERIAISPGEDLIAIEFRARWPDFVRHVNQVATPAGGVVQDFNSGSIRADPGLTPGRLSQLRLRFPHLLLLDALAARSSIRHLGTTMLRGREADVVAYTQPDGVSAALYVGPPPERSVLAHEVLVEDLRYGDASTLTLYDGYAARGGVFFPHVVRTLRAGVEQAVLRVDSVSLSATDLADAVAALDSVPLPTASVDTASAPVAGASPDRADASVDTVAPGVFLVGPAEAPNYRLLFVDLGDSLLAVEAPVSVTAVRAAIRAVREAVGPLPIAYAALTHHHSDHSAGIAAFAEEGATLLITPGNAAFVRDLVTSPRSMDEPRADRPDPRLRLVRDSLRLNSAAGPLILKDLGPTPHADEHVVALIPAIGLVFQGDMVQFPHDGGVEAARPQTHALAELLAELPWTVQFLAGVHGRVGTPADLDAAIAAAREAPR